MTAEEIRKALGKKGPWLMVVLVVGLIIYASFDTPDTPSFSAIDLVKQQIPPEGKRRVWYSEEWSQRAIDSNTWEVQVSDGIWKVSKNNSLCSRAGKLVGICSENGTAQKYSKLEYCMDSALCENVQMNAKSVDIVKELRSVDLSNLSYVDVKRDEVVRYAKVVGIPQIVKRAISYQSLLYEDRNLDAGYTDTCKALAKRYGLPEKAIECIYFEGIAKSWNLGL